jgi:hypothetical protein
MSIHWSVRYSTFAASVFTLSLFFAGWREVMQTGQPGAFALLAAGTLSTVLLLVVQAYWAYFDEKSKGKLVRPSKSFEKLHAYIDAHYANNKLVRYIQPESNKEGRGDK